MFYRYWYFSLFFLHLCLYDCPMFIISVFAGVSKYFMIQTHQWLDYCFFGQSIKSHLLHHSNFTKWGILEFQRLTDLHPLSVSNSRKMFCSWFQTLIILWKAVLRHRLNSLKARVKYVAVIKNNRTTSVLPTYQSFVVKVWNTHVEFVHHFNRAQKVLMAMLLILVLLQAPFSAVAFH